MERLEGKGNREAAPAGAFRDRATGQYAHRTMEALCTCGHPLGVHAAATERGCRPCFNGDAHAAGATGGEPCDCIRFRKSRKGAR